MSSLAFSSTRASSTTANSTARTSRGWSQCKNGSLFSRITAPWATTATKQTVDPRRALQAHISPTSARYPSMHALRVPPGTPAPVQPCLQRHAPLAFSMARLERTLTTAWAARSGVIRRRGPRPARSAPLAPTHPLRARRRALPVPTAMIRSRGRTCAAIARLVRTAWRV